MFKQCTSLVTVPTIAAKVMGDWCCYHMFCDCTSLIVSDTSGTGFDKAWKIPTTDAFSGSYDASTGMFLRCAGTRSTDNPAFSYN